MSLLVTLQQLSMLLMDNTGSVSVYYVHNDCERVNAWEEAKQNNKFNISITGTIIIFLVYFEVKKRKT